MRLTTEHFLIATPIIGRVTAIQLLGSSKHCKPLTAVAVHSVVTHPGMAGSTWAG